MTCKNILIIDDDDSIRESLADVLEDRGYQAYVASDGSSGLELLEKMGELPCVILLDMMMPGMNGWSFLEVQRQNPKYCDIPVIVCSAFPESAKTVRPDHYLPKPVQLRNLMNAVKAFCA